MTNVLAPYVKQKFFTANGVPAVSGTLTTYQGGTSILAATFGPTGTANANPIVLDSRGECDIWLTPNASYKFVLADAAGNLIWSVDQIVASQMQSLFAGTDTGVANSYVLNFAANFSSLVNGIILYWTPANSNTGASTLNVNNLGIVPIVNPDGSALQAGQLVGNQIAIVVYQNGVFQVINPGVTYGSFVGLWAGFLSNPNWQVQWRRTGLHVALYIAGGTSTSNGTGMLLQNLPLNITPAFTSQMIPAVGLTDNSLGFNGVAAVNNSSVVRFFKDATLNAAGWTASGMKGLTNTLLVYSL